jgi:hypothetical protein
VLGGGFELPTPLRGYDLDFPSVLAYLRMVRPFDLARGYLYSPRKLDGTGRQIEDVLNHPATVVTIGTPTR